MTASTSVAFGVGLYVAVGNNEEIFSSPDSVIWTLRHSGANTLQRVSFNDGLFIAVGDNSKCFTSPDGLVWTSQTTGILGDIDACGGGSGLYVAAGGVFNEYMTSPDGVTWTFLRNGTTANRVVYYSVANVIDCGQDI
jgi:hypothetical protein